MMKQKKVGLGTVVALTIAAAYVLTGCDGHRDGGSPPRELKIGAILPLTGNLAFLGQPELMGAQAAVAELSAEHADHRVSLLAEDSKGDPKEAVAAARRLVDIERVSLGIVSTSSAVSAVTPVFDAAGIPVIAMCSDSTVSARHPNAVNFYVNLDDEQRAMARHLRAEGVKQLAVLRVNAEAGQLAVDLLKKHYPELEITTVQTYDLKASNYKDVVAPLKDDKAHAIYIVGYGFRFPALLKSLKEFGIHKRLFGNYTFLSDAARADGVKLLLGVEFTSFPVTATDLSTTALGRYFHQQRPGALSPFLDYVFAYDGVKMWFECVKAGVALDQFAQYVRGKSFHTLFGPVKILPDGNAHVPMAISSYLPDGTTRIIEPAISGE